MSHNALWGSESLTNCGKASGQPGKTVPQGSFSGLLLGFSTVSPVHAILQYLCRLWWLSRRRTGPPALPLRREGGGGASTTSGSGGRPAGRASLELASGPGGSGELSGGLASLSCLIGVCSLSCDSSVLTAFTDCLLFLGLLAIPQESC